jgi:hypothetical protein
MKERRRLRQVRGRVPSLSGSFTGVGSHAATIAGGGSWSDNSSVHDEAAAAVAGVGIQMTQPKTAQPSASTSMPLLAPDADEQRYAGMLSEEIEEELERAERTREAQMQQLEAHASQQERKQPL